MRAGPAEGFTELIALVRGALREQPAQAAALVNAWFDEDPARHAAAVLAAELGTHREQQAVYELLTLERRAALQRRLVARCRAEGRRGMTAGCFTLGRFACTPEPVAFWNRLDDGDAAYLLEEWVLHARYLRVLDEVGERRIRRARERIDARGLAEIRVTRGDAVAFVSLKLSERDLARVAALCGAGADPQTLRLLELLRGPYGELFDFDAPWSMDRLRRICAAAGLPLPGPDES